jgi:hypothetical protein
MGTFADAANNDYRLSVKKQCSGYEFAGIVMNPLYTLPLTSHHYNKDVYKGATL